MAKELPVYRRSDPRAVDHATPGGYVNFSSHSRSAWIFGPYDEISFAESFEPTSRFLKYLIFFIQRSKMAIPLLINVAAVPFTSTHGSNSIAARRRQTQIVSYFLNTIISLIRIQLNNKKVPGYQK